MNKTFQSNEWNNYLLHFKDQPINILEIGIDDGNVLQQFIDIFLKSNENTQYYGIDTWEESKNEEIARDIVKNSKQKDNIHLIKKDSIIAISELIIKNISFDIIYINSLYVRKNLSTDSSLCMKLLKHDGIIIFNNYIMQKIESNVLNPNIIINSIINIYNDEIEILYIGYNVILKKIKIKDHYLNSNIIINKFINILDEYWHFNDINEYAILLNLSELPSINPKYDNLENIKIRELNGIEIFDNLKISHLMYKYIPLTKLNQEIKNNKNNKYNDITKSINKIYRISLFNKYELFNNINRNKNATSKKYSTYNPNSVYIVSTEEINDDIKEKEKGEIKNYIDILGVVNDKNKIKKLFDDVKSSNIKFFGTSAKQFIKYMDFSKMYNNILLQILLCKYVLHLDGSFVIQIDIRFDFINDLLLLLNHIFNKVIIFILTNKIGRLCLRIVGRGFLGINNNLFDKIYDIITKTDKEIISLFDKQNIYINTDSLQNNIFKQSKEIIIYMNKYTNIIEENIEKINMSITMRTINDIITYLL